jgi:hypothetical protein
MLLVVNFLLFIIINQAYGHAGYSKPSYQSCHKAIGTVILECAPLIGSKSVDLVKLEKCLIDIGFLVICIKERFVDRYHQKAAENAIKLLEQLKQLQQNPNGFPITGNTNDNINNQAMNIPLNTNNQGINIPFNTNENTQINYPPILNLPNQESNPQIQNIKAEPTSTALGSVSSTASSSLTATTFPENFNSADSSLIAIITIVGVLAIIVPVGIWSLISYFK